MADGRRILGWALAGSAVAALFIVRPAWWCFGLVAGIALHGALLVLPSWRGRARSIRAQGRGALAFAVPGVGLPAAVAAAAWSAGTLDVLRDTLRVALPADAATWWVREALAVVAAVLLGDGARDRRDARSAGVVLGVAVAVAVVFRAAWIASVAASPSEVYWSDGPYLVNALKLTAGEPLYGAADRLDAYPYSPGVDLLHRALLAPIGLALSLHAARVVVIVEQLASAGVAMWALWPLLPRARLAAGGVLVLAALSSLVAPSVHPDHGVLLCTAVALALVIAEERWGRVAWWCAFLGVTPIATSFKLSGAGIGLGLVLVCVAEKRWSRVAGLAGSALACFATVPLFDATLGRFSYFALENQGRSPIEWHKLGEVVTTPFVVAACVAFAAVGVVWALDRVPPESRVRRAVVLTVTCGITSIGGFLKYTARDNNLTPLLFAATVLLLLAGREKLQGRTLHPLLAPIVALLLVMWARPLEPPLSSAARAAVRGDRDAVVGRLRDDVTAHRSSLALLHAAAWIEAGRRDVPRDRLMSGLELAIARRPEAELLARHIDDGRYDTVVAAGPLFGDEGGLRGAYARQIREAIERHYDRVYPEGPVLTRNVRGAVVFLRRSKPGVREAPPGP